MTYQSIASELQNDFEYVLDSICDKLDSKHVPAIAQLVFRSECQNIFEDKVTFQLTAKHLEKVSFHKDWKFSIFSIITKHTYNNDRSQPDILDYVYNEIKDITFVSLKDIIINHFKDFEYLSPENKYFVLKTLREQRFIL